MGENRPGWQRRPTYQSEPATESTTGTPASSSGTAVAIDWYTLATEPFGSEDMCGGGQTCSLPPAPLGRSAIHTPTVRPPPSEGTTLADTCSQK